MDSDEDNMATRTSMKNQEEDDHINSLPGLVASKRKLYLGEDHIDMNDNGDLDNSLN